MKGEIIRVSGAREPFEGDWHELEKLLGCDTFDSVNLHDGRVMIVDDIGLLVNRPINPEATKLYHKICRPGTTQPIVGDVCVIEEDEDDG